MVPGLCINHSQSRTNSGSETPRLLCHRSCKDRYSRTPLSISSSRASSDNCSEYSHSQVVFSVHAGRQYSGAFSFTFSTAFSNPDSHPQTICIDIVPSNTKKTRADAAFHFNMYLFFSHSPCPRSHPTSPGQCIRRQDFPECKHCPQSNSHEAQAGRQDPWPDSPAKPRCP